jgi:hypothetical protein
MILTYVIFSPPCTYSRLLDPSPVTACVRPGSLLPHWSSGTSEVSMQDGLCLGILFVVGSIMVNVLLKF